jgi:hypothetical protein
LQRPLAEGIIAVATGAATKTINEPVATPDGYVPLSEALGLIAAALFPNPETGWKAILDRQAFIIQSYEAIRVHAASLAVPPANRGAHEEATITVAQERESMALQAAEWLRARIAAENLTPYIFDRNGPRALPGDGWQRRLDVSPEEWVGDFSGDHVGPDLMFSMGPDTVHDGVRRAVYFMIADIETSIDRIVNPAGVLRVVEDVVAGGASARGDVRFTKENTYSSADEALFPEITARIDAHSARSADQAALQLAEEGRVVGPGTAKSKASRLAKAYRARAKRTPSD